MKELGDGGTLLMAFFPTGLLERVGEGGGGREPNVVYLFSHIKLACSFSNKGILKSSIFKELVKISHHALHCMYSAHCTF